MSRHAPPDHRGPEAVAGLRRRMIRKGKIKLADDDPRKFARQLREDIDRGGAR